MTSGLIVPGSNPALCDLKKFAARFVQQRGAHLTTGTIMDADEQDFLLWHLFSFR
jgi:hypothetical protein